MAINLLNIQKVQNVPAANAVELEQFQLFDVQLFLELRVLQNCDNVQVIFKKNTHSNEHLKGTKVGKALLTNYRVSVHQWWLMVARSLAHLCKLPIVLSLLRIFNCKSKCDYSSASSTDTGSIICVM